MQTIYRIIITVFLFSVSLLSRAQTDTALVREPAMVIMKHSFLHDNISVDRTTLSLKGIYANDTSIWFKLRLSNHSLVSYHPSFISFSVRDKNQSKRTAQQQTVLQPIFLQDDIRLPGETSATLIAGFKGFMVPKGKLLFIEAAEQNGARALVLRIKHRKLLRAKKLF